MGLVTIEGAVTGPSGETRKIEFLIDSGASYSLPVAECKIAVAGEEGHTPVILGEPGDEPLLGVITLENLGLVLNPFKRTLEVMRLRLG